MKISTFFLLVSICNNLLAQNFKLIPTIGSNISFQSISDLGIKGKKTIKPGLDIGIISDLQVKKNLSVELGFFHSLNRASLHRLFVYPFPTTTDSPVVIENYSLSFLKLPVSLKISSNKEKSGFINFGPLVKYSLTSKRDGETVDFGDKYSNKFLVETKNGRRVGIGILCSVGKNFEISNQLFSLRINYDTDLSEWRYPTNFELEKKMYYKMYNHNISLLLSYQIR